MFDVELNEWYIGILFVWQYFADYKFLRCGTRMSLQEKKKFREGHLRPRESAHSCWEGEEFEPPENQTGSEAWLVLNLSSVGELHE